MPNIKNSKWQMSLLLSLFYSTGTNDYFCSGMRHKQNGFSVSQARSMRPLEKVTMKKNGSI